jgi:hypothetical protein
MVNGSVSAVLALTFLFLLAGGFLFAIDLALEIVRLDFSSPTSRRILSEGSLHFRSWQRSTSKY